MIEIDLPSLTTIISKKNSFHDPHFVTLESIFYY